MLERISRFFLTNTNIAVVVIVAVIFTGVASYIMLPKQYNPSIVAPAFAIGVPVPAYSSADAYRGVATTLENVLSELPRIDTILSTSREGSVSVMVSFKVGTDQEDAKTRLYDRLTARSDLRPFGVQDVSIKAIDPEDLPQLSLAIVSTATGLSAEDA
jgi:multidrug efflux pump